MQKLLRAAGRTARVFLWIVKGLLLLLAAATLVIWPISRGKEAVAFAFKLTAQPERVDKVFAGVGNSNGRIIAWHGTDHYLGGDILGMSRLQVASSGEGWQWQTVLNGDLGFPNQYSDGWGPLRWQFHTMRDPDYAAESRYFAVSCWLLAPLLALWPLTSLTLLFRRRTFRRRRLTFGCCQHCGYDLRATAEANGPLLPRCPECGAASTAVVSKGECSATENTKDTERS